MGLGWYWICVWSGNDVILTVGVLLSSLESVFDAIMVFVLFCNLRLCCVVLISKLPHVWYAKQIKTNPLKGGNGTKNIFDPGLAVLRQGERGCGETWMVLMVVWMYRDLGCLLAWWSLWRRSSAMWPGLITVARAQVMLWPHCQAARFIGITSEEMWRVGLQREGEVRVEQAAGVSFRLDIHDHCRQSQRIYGHFERGLGKWIPMLNF